MIILALLLNLYCIYNWIKLTSLLKVTRIALHVSFGIVYVEAHGMIIDPTSFPNLLAGHGQPTWGRSFWRLGDFSPRAHRARMWFNGKRLFLKKEKIVVKEPSFHLYVSIGGRVLKLLIDLIWNRKEISHPFWLKVGSTQCFKVGFYPEDKTQPWMVVKNQPKVWNDT